MQRIYTGALLRAHHRLMMVVCLLANMLVLVVAANSPAWAASVPVRAGETVPPFACQVQLPLVVTSPMPINVTHHPVYDFGPA